MFFRILLAAVAVAQVSGNDGLGDGAAPINTLPKNLVCESYLGAKCGGLLNRLCPGTSVCSSGKCACPPGTCASPVGLSKCVDYGYTPSTTVRKDTPKIACPVLAALYNDGTLRPDELGRVTLDHLKEALHNGAGADTAFATFQASGVAAYKEGDLDEKSRERCMMFSACWWRKVMYGEEASTQRYLNIFKMDLNPLVQHGYSTATRKDTKVQSAARLFLRPVGQNSTCESYPCEARFQEFWADHADQNGRLYKENIGNVICYAKDHGDTFGEYSLDDKPFLRQWQMKAATRGWLDMIGLEDEKGEKYIRVEDARTMFMEGRMPDGWQRRHWGPMKDVVKQVTWKLPCGDDAPPAVINALPNTDVVAEKVQSDKGLVGTGAGLRPSLAMCALLAFIFW